ncbi:endonuclease domain-containing protein [Streptomyces griseoflavus]|uniref:endonuclease domain-containing protein n=1 Tax=Streptomyces griseoflavus TaxID=35619 RepID=UPI001E2964D1|nr:endonuclease domain-containing protein [Streptomyces griseoflavus]
MATLDELPPYRRAQLVWRWAHQGLAYVEGLVRNAEKQPCHLPSAPPGPPGQTLAVPGDDGRFHLEQAGQLLCGETETADGWSHHQHCGWIERERGPEEWMGGRLDDPDAVTWGSLVVEWTVRPTGPGVDPGIVERPDRCHGGRYELLHLWPPRPARTASVRRLRAALVAELGPDCHLCGLYPGAMVDHDHQTGQVRGLLCAFCNRVLEECPHLTDCPRADYLLSPPAAGLNLRYPASQEATRQRKIELLGFDPFEGLHPALLQTMISTERQGKCMSNGISITGQLDPHEWSNEDTAAYEAAIEAVNGAVGAYSALIAAEKAKDAPEQGVIDDARAARSRLAREREGLRSTDREQIAATRARYAQLAREVLAGIA